MSIAQPRADTGRLSGHRGALSAASPSSIKRHGTRRGPLEARGRRSTGSDGSAPASPPPPPRAAPLASAQCRCRHECGRSHVPRSGTDQLARPLARAEEAPAAPLGREAAVLAPAGGRRRQPRLAGAGGASAGRAGSAGLGQVSGLVARLLAALGLLVSVR